MAAGLGLLAEMALVRVQKDVITYNAAFSACEKGQQWQLVLGLLAEMAFVMVHKDVITYNAAISACEKGQQWRLIRMWSHTVLRSVPVLGAAGGHGPCRS